MQEPLGNYETPLRFVVLHTDGIDTKNKGTAVTPIPDTQVLLVNGSGVVGSLSAMKPVRFESIGAAYRYIAALVKKAGSR